MILHGDCLERLKELEDNSVDSVVTDPPYGLKFMGKKWDYDVPSKEVWLEVFRVIKPGGHLLSFGGTRTYHHLAMAIDLAGFEIRDQLQWLYGSGFPKSHDISKAIDKAAGAEREVIERVRVDGKKPGKVITGFGSGDPTKSSLPATPEAYRYKGWGTALKPANEPIVLARKPLEKGLTVAENMLKWGVGGLNIDESRIVGNPDNRNRSPGGVNGNGNTHGHMVRPDFDNSQGRWPANLLLDEIAAEMLDEQTQDLHGAGSKRAEGTAEQTANGGVTSYQLGQNPRNGMRFGDSGGASRFFYVAKASKRERNAGLEGEVKQKQGARPNSADSSGKFPDHDHRETGGNNHPTVKPIKLMEYLCKLITPAGGVVLDPFMGSGSTGVAAFKNGFKFIGIEMNEEYCEIARRRIDSSRSS